MTESQVRKLVEKRMREQGSMRRLAKEWGMTAGNLSRYLDGQYRAGPKILGPLGLKVREVVYEQEKP